MGSILLAPHNLGDDETLFAAYTCLRFKPLVAVCYQSVVQEKHGIFHSDREAETAEACAILGVEFEQWLFPDTRTKHAYMAQNIADAAHRFETCYAPAFEEDGHEQHNHVATLAEGAFGEDRVVSYLTYRRGSPRTRGHIAPREKTWPGLKLRAMACYQSQVNLAATRSWFDDWTEEWYA